MKPRLIPKVKPMASSIYNIIKSMYNEIQSNVTQGDFNQNTFNGNYKVMDYSQGNGNQRTNSVRTNTPSSNTQSSNTQSSNNQRNNTPSNNIQSNVVKSNNNLRNYNQNDDIKDSYYGGENSSIINANQSSNDKQKEAVKKLQQAVIMAEILSQPVCRTRGYKRNKRSR